MRTLGLVLALTLAGCLGGTADANEPEPIPEHLTCQSPCERLVNEDTAWNFEPHTDINPIDPNFRVIALSVFEELPEAFDTAQRWTHIDITKDGGQTWTRQRLPGGPNSETDHPLATCTSLFDAFVEFEPDGTLIVGGIGEGAAPTPTNPGVSEVNQGRPAWKDLILAKSTDQGATWTFQLPLAEAHRISPACTPPVNQGDPQCTEVCVRSVVTRADKPFMEVSPSGDAAIYVQVNPEAQVWVREESWVRLPNLDAGCREYSADLVFHDGLLHAAFTCYGASLFAEGTWHAVFDGTEWLVTQLSSTSTAYPAITAGVSGIWIVYPEADGANSGGHQTLVVRNSEDGRDWSPPIVVDEPDEAGYMIPTLAVDGHGIAYTGFYHHLRDDGRSADAVYVVAAIQNGIVSKVQVSEALIEYQSLGLQLGHYMGLAGWSGGVMATWISGSPGDSKVHVAELSFMKS